MMNLDNIRPNELEGHDGLILRQRVYTDYCKLFPKGEAGKQARAEVRDLLRLQNLAYPAEPWNDLLALERRRAA